MRIHQETYNQLMRGKENFSGQLFSDVEILLEIVNSNSPITDVSILLNNKGLKLQGISIKEGAGRVPIRNLLRILAKLSTISGINNLHIMSFRNGCDNFSGFLEYEQNGSRKEGNFDWQWTSFGDGGIHYNKFLIFPEPIHAEITSEL